MGNDPNVINNQRNKYDTSTNFSSSFDGYRTSNTIYTSSKVNPKEYSNKKNKINNKINNKTKLNFEEKESNILNEPEIRNYTFVRDLGTGGFGKVKLYKENRNSQKLVAVKEFIGVNENNFPKEIKKEKNLLLEISHPYIIKYLFSCFDNNNFYIGMEFCINRDLDFLINENRKNNQKLDEEFIWKVAFQTLKALEYLHVQKKVVHNDVKPLNLLLNENYDIKLTDFGISGVMPVYSIIRSTMKISDNYGSKIFSTPPEFLKGRQTTFKSDIWALGCTLYFLANLEAPFKGNNDQLEINILQSEPDHLDKKYSNELDSFIFKMLDKDSLKRPSSTACLNLIPPRYKLLFGNKLDLEPEKTKKDFTPLFFGIDVPDIPSDIKKEFYEYYYLVYEFPKFTLRDFLCYHCEQENKKAYPFIKIDFFKRFEEVNCFCQNGHYSVWSLVDFYKNFTSSKFYRNEISELYCTDCKRDNDYYPREHYKFCEICKKVLCPKCEKIHNNINQTHSLKDRYVEENSSCLKHYKNYEYFCNDCRINLCEDCSFEHEENNPNHDIIEIKNEIDDDNIKEINLNIENIKKSIITAENLIKTKQCNINKFYFLNTLNRMKLILLYKMTLLNMYQKNKSNYIIIKNLVENSMIIPKLEISIDLDEFDEKNDKLYEVMSPMNDKSISRYREIIHLSLHKDKISSVLLYKDWLITFSEDKTIKILDKEKFNTLKEINDEFDLPIFEAIKLKNGDILVGYGNKIKIISFEKEEKKITTKQIFDNFTEDNISKVLELNTGIILVLCNGELFAFKKEENMYKLYKKNINYKEYIYSMIELDESSFLIVCEISNFSNNFNTQYHFQIYDSKDILMTYNYCYKYNFIKNKYNVCKFNNDFILFCLYSYPFSNNYDMLFFNFRDKINFQFRVNMNHFQVYKIFNKSFLGLAYSNGKFYLNQIEITSLNNNSLNQNRGGVLIFNEEIDKNFIIEEMIIISDKKGKIKNLSNRKPIF